MAGVAKTELSYYALQLISIITKWITCKRNEVGKALKGSMQAVIESASASEATFYPKKKVVPLMPPIEMMLFLEIGT